VITWVAATCRHTTAPARGTARLTFPVESMLSVRKMLRFPWSCALIFSIAETGTRKQPAHRRAVCYFSIIPCPRPLLLFPAHVCCSGASPLLPPSVRADGIRCHQDPQGEEWVVHPGHQEEHHRHLPIPQLSNINSEIISRRAVASLKATLVYLMCSHVCTYTQLPLRCKD